MGTTCVHSCKGLCTALGAAERREQDALEEYSRLAEECDYPDVRQLLERLVAEHQRTLGALRETRAMLEGRFDSLDRITESFR